MSLADQKMRGREMVEMVEERRKIFQLKINLVCLAAGGCGGWRIAVRIIGLCHAAADEGMTILPPAHLQCAD